MTSPRPINILLADDDEDDVLLAVQALNKHKPANNLYCVHDGEQLMAFLRKEGDYTEETAPTPDLILLDLNMPKKNGCEALKEIRTDDSLIHIPVVILTTSESEQDIAAAYRLGANSYVNKPGDFDGLVDMMKTLTSYWTQSVKLPPNGARHENGRSYC